MLGFSGLKQGISCLPLPRRCSKSSSACEPDILTHLGLVVNTVSMEEAEQQQQ